MECSDSLLIDQYTVEEEDGEAEAEKEEQEEEEEEEEEALAVLRYEGQITELLVVIAELNRKIDRLTVTTIREDDEYLDTCSDLSDGHYVETSSCLCPDQGHSAASNCPGQPYPTSRNTDEPCDLSRTLHRVLTELEEAVHARKTENPHRGTNPAEEEEATLMHWELVTQTIEAVERELDIDLSPELREERSQWEAELECLREKNQHLLAELCHKDQELRRVTEAVGGIQLERDKLRLKVDGLHSCIQRVGQSAIISPPPSLFTGIVGTVTGGSSIISNEREALMNRDPGFVVERLMPSFQDCPSLQQLSQLFRSQGSNLTRVTIQDSEMEADQLRNIDMWKGRNDLLSAVLEECKGDCERLSLLLGKHESNGTALRLALQYSEECIEAYGLLLAKAESKGSSMWRRFDSAATAPGELARWHADKDGGFGGQETMGKMAADARTRSEKLHGGYSGTAGSQRQVPSEKAQYSVSGEPGVDDSESRLRGDVARLRLGYAAIRQTILELGDTPPHLRRYVVAARDGEAGTGSREIVPAAQGLVVPGTSSPSLETFHGHRKGKKELLQDLVAVREEMSELKGQLSWMKKERRSLEQSLRSQEPQDEATRLLLAHWQAERDERLGEQPRAGCLKEVTTSASEAPVTCNDQLVSELTMVSIREKQLRARIEVLVISLEKLIEKKNNQKEQYEELTTELRKTHSNLSTAYRSAKRKYDNQLTKLESQVLIMSERQAAQLQALGEKATRLQEELDNANGTPL
ncbi:colorectal mutant cancer protein-like isoform X2 [Heptranchias perlo]|uniref:colorectal mutant cancer protein-like isoform X2 n=1 Tax=Heptranchias perlo TaxID=212740 RepID=UPI003559CD78